MLALDSKRWEELRAVGGSPRLLLQLIQRLSEAPSDDDWAEVFEQIAHQWTLESSAYAAFPHLLSLAIEQGITKTPGFMLNMSRIAAPLERTGPCPGDLKDEFEAAIRQGAQLAIAAALNGPYEPADYVWVLQAAAALSGRGGVTTGLIFQLKEDDPDLDLGCSRCPALLSGYMDEGGCWIQAMDYHMKPVSNRAPVTLRDPGSATWSERSQPADDFDWLASLCRAAGQETVLLWLRFLYGAGTCPVCGSKIDIVNEITRQRDTCDPTDPETQEWLKKMAAYRDEHRGNRGAR